MSQAETILLVEDERAMRDSCRQALEQAGYRVVEASSGKEAEKILLREEIDLIITDLRMPDGSGQELVARAKEVFSNLPIILITAYPSVESAVQSFKSGIVDYLIKPFTGDQLVEVAESALKENRSCSSRRVALVEFEKDYLVRVMKQHNGNITHTSQSLGIHRTTLQRLIKKYKVSPRP